MNTLFLIGHCVHIPKNNYGPGCYRLINGAGKWLTKMRFRRHLPLWERNTPPLPPSNHWSVGSSAKANQHEKTQGGQWRLKSIMFNAARLQHIITETKQQWLKKKIVKAKAAQGTDLLNLYFLIAKNSIKRVNLHLWKSRDNDSTVNKG